MTEPFPHYVLQKNINGRPINIAKDHKVICDFDPVFSLTMLDVWHLEQLVNYANKGLILSKEKV